MWPFTRRRETRSSASGSYTTLLASALLDATTGSTAANPSTIGALEVCAGMWARAFASARVEPATTITAAVTPDVLACIGRQIVL